MFLTSDQPYSGGFFSLLWFPVFFLTISSSSSIISHVLWRSERLAVGQVGGNGKDLGRVSLVISQGLCSWVEIVGMLLLAECVRAAWRWGLGLCGG